jgi:oxaloacetate decarboxylase beta subunit
MLPPIVNIFQGLLTFFTMEPLMAILRLILILLGILLLYLGYRNVLEPLIMVPMGLSMAVVNAAIMLMAAQKYGTLFLDPFAGSVTEVVDALQIYFLQPIYTLTFTNGLIACLVFAGIGVLTDLDFFIVRPGLSMLLAIAAELGTIATLPIAYFLGFSLRESASIAIVGGADGPMVLFTTLMLARNLFVPITIVAYVYLSITYAVYPYLMKALIPRHMRGTFMDPHEIPSVSSREKFAFSVVACILLSLLFPVAAPLFVSFFLGVIVKEAKITRYQKFFDEVLLTGSTLFLGFVLGALLSVNVILDMRIFLILILGMVALLLSGLGGLAAGVAAYYLSHKKINPLIGIAAVSCVPTTAKVAQKVAQEANPETIILPFAMGPNVAGVITTAIICAIYVTLLPLL